MDCSHCVVAVAVAGSCGAVKACEMKAGVCSIQPKHTLCSTSTTLLLANEGRALLVC
jgi:hypothetical protein